MTQFFKLRYLLIVALQLGLMIGLRVLLPAEYAGNESSDYQTFYRPVASAILAGEGVRLNGAPALRCPPGYPVLLSGVVGLPNVTGLSEGLALFLFVALCAAGSAAVLTKLSEGIWGERWGWLAGVVWASYPLQLWVAKQPNSEIPFVFLLYLSLLVTWKALTACRIWPGFLGGVLAGFSMLVRPIGIGVGVILPVLALGFAKGRLRARALLAACVLAGTFLSIAPWEVWVHRQTGRVIPLSTSGPASMVDGLTFAAKPEQANAAYFLVPSAVLPVMEDMRAHRKGLAGTSQVLRAVARLAKREPLRVVLLLATKAARSWYATDCGRLEKPVLLVQIPYLLLSILAMLLAWRAGASFRKAGLAVGALVLYFWMMTVAVLSIARYMVPAAGLFFVLWPVIPVVRGNVASTRKPVNAGGSQRHARLLPHAVRLSLPITANRQPATRRASAETSSRHLASPRLSSATIWERP